MVRLHLLALVATVHFSHGWLPIDGSRKLLDARGLSLFDSQHTTGHNLKGVHKRWWMTSGKIRGVNLGSLFLLEPWLATTEWSKMGCDGQETEFDCVKSLGQERADAAFQKHWDTWITEGDFDEMVEYGLNTIRIPLGYWLDESLVDRKSEYFPKGALKYLIRLCGWASDRGLYIILDQHGAPGSQVANHSFTGQFPPTPGFYNEYQYGRAVKFVVFLRKLAHDHTELRNVGTIELVNEPLYRESAVPSVRSIFYKNAYNAIRKLERDLGVATDKYVHIQMMSSLWGSGNPVEFLNDTYFTAFDDHRYLKWVDKQKVPWTQESYISATCADNRSSDTAGPTIVGEWSISPPSAIENSEEWDRNTHKDFYKKWFAAQVLSYERWTSGWAFWTWKAELGDYRWSYKEAVAAGVIPKDLKTITNNGICSW